MDKRNLFEELMTGVNEMSENKKETSIINCRGCGKTKERIYAGKYPDNRNSRWVDENGREFSGRMCPECHAEKQAQHQRLKKANSKVK